MSFSLKFKKKIEAESEAAVAIYTCPPEKVKVIPI